MFEPINESVATNRLFESLSQERKQLQAEGLLPLWYTTQAWQMFKDKYAHTGEQAVLGRHSKIAETLSKHLPVELRDEYCSKFLNLLWGGLLSPSTPALTNVGTKRGQPVACSGQVIGDSIKDFYGSMQETALLSKHGYGTSGYFGGIRSRGTKFGEGGIASGAKEVIDDFFTTASKVSQGGKRRGVIAAYIEIDHPDFYECLHSLKSTPNGKNYGWNISDAFIQRLINGDEDAHERWKDALHVKLLTGKGYLFFPDKANRHRPQMYKDLGLDIIASNLCVAPETMILTDKGHVAISSAVNQQVNVWNGSEYSEVTVRKTGSNQPLVLVTTSTGQQLKCTPYHRFYIQAGYGSSNVKMVEAQDLKEGDKLIRLDTPVIHGYTHFREAYMNGFYSGDGSTVTEGNTTKNRIYLYGEKRKLLNRFHGIEQHYVQDKQDREYFHVPALKPKFTVPTTEHTVQSRLDWLAGYLDADGTVTRNGDSQSVQATSTNKAFLLEVQLMLQTLGVQSKVAHMRDAGVYQLPANDGSGSLKEYQCAELFRLLISGSATYDLIKAGLVTHRLVLNASVPNRNAQRFTQVTAVVDAGFDDTYCFNEPKKHLGVFNGLLTGQCTEIMLFSDTKHTFSCILASMNLVHWKMIKESSAVFDSMVFLDCLVSESLHTSKDVKGLKKVRRSTKKGRAVGLGVMGFHTYLQSQGIPYESLEAQYLHNEIFKHLHDETLRASKWLAELLGEPEWCKGTGLRNTHRTAKAPTKSTALLMGGVSESDFPDPGMVFTSGSSVGELDRITPVIYETMKAKGVYNPDTIKDIVQHLGSVQHVSWLSDEEKKVFKNAFEIDQRIILRRTSLAQKWVCQGQSLNFYISDENAEIILSDLMSAVALDEEILSSYYVYTRSGVVISDVCVGCSG